MRTGRAAAGSGVPWMSEHQGFVFGENPNLRKPQTIVEALYASSLILNTIGHGDSDEWQEWDSDLARHCIPIAAPDDEIRDFVQDAGAAIDSIRRFSYAAGGDEDVGWVANLGPAYVLWGDMMEEAGLWSAKQIDAAMAKVPRYDPDAYEEGGWARQVDKANDARLTRLFPDIEDIIDFCMQHWAGKELALLTLPDEQLREWVNRHYSENWAE